MKKLFPKQQEAVDFHLRTLPKYGASLDSSKTGVGKTVVSCHTARKWGGPVAVICPKIVIPHWKRELKEMGVEPLFVWNYEKLKTGKQSWVKRRGRSVFEWRLPENTLLIWDEVHKCKAPTSQNSQMLIAAINQNIHSLMLSATACKDPTEMRSIGYALKLHNLLRSGEGLVSWPSWLKTFGCWRDQWRNWKPPRNAERLQPLHEALYPERSIRLTPSDLPLAFAENHIITEPLHFAALKDIQKFYEESGITSEILEWYLADPSFGGEEEVIVQLLRARQLAEAAKVPDIVEMANDLIEEGNSVAIFVNYRETALTLHSMLSDCSLIIGQQKDDDREEQIQLFQSDIHHCVISTISAGGVGVSLHDVRGERPRVSLISPTYDEKEYEQALGRIHRNGAKSPATQRVLVAADTLEEQVIAVLHRKLKFADILHNGNK